MVDEVRGDLPDLEHVFFLGDEVHELLRDAPDEIEWPELDFDEPINIQYTSGTTGSPKGATLSHHNILNNGFFVGEFCNYTEQDRVCIPVPFYHCFGMVMGNLGGRHPRRLHGHPGAGLRAEGDARGGRRGALHEPLRRADDVHRRARAPRLRLLRPELAADRDHGRLAVPRAGHAQGHRPHAHGGRDHLLRHDRDLARLDPDDRRGRARAPRRHGRARAPARRGQDRRAGDRPHRRARRAGRAVHARLLGDARLLGGPRAHRGGDRPRALDAHRRPRDDGRRGLREDRRPVQGHDHPRRRERLPARDRGVPLHPRRDLRRLGLRRAGPALRRGGDGVGDPARRRLADRGRAARVLPRARSPTTRCRATSRSSTPSR